MWATTSVNGNDWPEYVDRFGDRITVCHLHTNDRENETHDPFQNYEPIVDAVELHTPRTAMKNHSLFLTPVISNRAPPVSLAATAIDQPCALTICSTICNPSPVPSSDVE